MDIQLQQWTAITFPFIHKCLNAWRGQEPPFDEMEIEMIHFIIQRWETEKKSDWISVEDRLPPKNPNGEGTRVLMRTNTDFAFMVGRYNHHTKKWADASLALNSLDKVTDWKSLPPPPNVSGR